MPRHGPSYNDGKEQVEKFCLGVGHCRDDQGLVGFVNMIRDGRLHAFIEGTMVGVQAEACAQR